ncbi:helix-turn-helix domain-containing protein [Chitinophaga cymbidii]|uniref:helix-turn-helix domain-containing protein n=1 Tax=Chitinophaga cymbidii TaxID=1096750 RepID=UPI00164CB3AA|nr:AraC family transcriptional regulator [Chitinophaga cymbidii]
MVCERCIHSIRQVLRELNIPVTNISLGEITTVSALSAPDIAALSEKLAPLGFSLLEDKKTKLARDIKKIVEQVYSGSYDFPEKFKFSETLAKKLNKEFTTLSSIFSEVEGITLEKYIIEFRIEKIKEFLVYTDDSLTNIAYNLGFSSIGHLSRQFKANTGLPPSHFQKIRQNKQSLSGKGKPAN